MHDNPWTRLPSSPPYVLDEKRAALERCASVIAIRNLKEWLANRHYRTRRRAKAAFPHHMP